MAINTIIIGLGSVGLLYDYNKSNLRVTHSKSVFKNRRFKLISAIDPNIEKRKLFSKKYKARAFKSIENFIENNKYQIDLAIISTPTSKHLMNFKKLLKAIFPKVILLEKPMGKNLSHAKEICRIIKKKKIKGFVNYIRNADKGYIYIKKFIKKNLKKKFYVNINFSGDILNNSSHYINLCNFLFGKLKIKKIKKSLFNLQNSRADISFNILKLKKDFFDMRILSDDFKICIEEHIDDSIIIEKLKNKKNNNNIFNLRSSRKMIKTSSQNIQEEVLFQIQNYFDKKRYFLSNTSDALYVQKMLCKLN